GTVEHQVARPLLERTADDPFVFAPAEVEYPVEITEEPGKPACLVGMVSLYDRLQDGGAEGRSQDLGHQNRQDHGRDYRDGELAIDNAGRTAEESHREEDRGQDSRDAPEGARNLAHGLDCGVTRR